ncbi:hypothetical protein [Streptomyces sp. B15]|uniref:hypothetical protein n=1 Tax=Streptomyces sp. B15 TaxID=1537797 RepID=UPI001B37D8F6|nr:hypothetical protein [Streptomyces sp. B15]MBQ1124635.1 hypothetical protein [Streptomyces sp. B15]
MSPAASDDPGFALVIGRPTHRFSVDVTRLPVPGIARIALELLGCRNLGRGEKLAWEYTFLIDGHCCSLAHQKFGLRLYVDAQALPAEDDAKALCERVVSLLEKSQRYLERYYLRGFADEQIRQGKVTIRNQYRRLHDLYEYFREGAELAFAGKGRVDGDLGNGWHLIAPEETEGFYNTVAMVSAYFSLLEHNLVLLLPFVGFDPSKESLKSFIGDRWGAKFKKVFPVGENGSVKAHFDELHRIAEEYRNTYGHGGFDKFGSTMLFHMKGIGALPAVLSDIRERPYFSFVPVGVEDFGRIKRSFDAFDEWLDDTAAPLAMKWIKGGLDVYYDERFRAEVASAMQSSEDFLAMADYYCYRVDQAANMDW